MKKMSLNYGYYKHKADFLLTKVRHNNCHKVLLDVIAENLGKTCFNRNMSRIVRKPDFCLGENKGADQLRGNREADQRLCFRYTDSTISLLLKSEISSF